MENRSVRSVDVNVHHVMYTYNSRTRDFWWRFCVDFDDLTLPEEFRWIFIRSCAKVIIVCRRSSDPHMPKKPTRRTVSKTSLIVTLLLLLSSTNHASRDLTTENALVYNGRVNGFSRRTNAVWNSLAAFFATRTTRPRCCFVHRFDAGASGIGPFSGRARCCSFEHWSLLIRRHGVGPTAVDRDVVRYPQHRFCLAASTSL